MNTPAQTAQTQAASRPERSIRQIGVIGLGRMGSDFAANLIADGFQVAVYDLNREHAAPLIAMGATGAAGLRDLGDCEAVLTALPDDDACSLPLRMSVTNQMTPASRSGRASSGRARKPPSKHVVSMALPAFSDRMNRREFITLLGGAAATAPIDLAARA